MAKTKKSSAPTLSEIVDQLNKTLDAVEAQLGPDAPALTGDQKKRTARTRKGGERVLQMIAELAKAHGLDSPSLASSTMLDQQSRASTFASALARLQKLEKRVSDEQFVAQSDAWSMGLQFYALMQRRATTDGTLASSLDPITSFFNYRHESTKATKLETRANAKLRDAQRLVARAKPRASVLEAEYESQHDVTSNAPVATTPAPVAQASKPAPVVSIIQPAPVPQPAPIVQPASTGGSNGATNGASNGVSNGAINGASNGYVNGVGTNGASSV